MYSFSNEKIGYSPKYKVEAQNVIEELKKYMLVDGFDLVLDLDKSDVFYFVDARTGEKYCDFFTCFASLPLGLNHPKLNTPNFINYLGKIALNKPSNSDIYSEVMATFVKTFFKTAVPDYFKYSFYISGGALAVENALKTAFDWKVRKNLAKGIIKEEEKAVNRLKIIHFREAFHGRSGYTMSLTNTDPTKVQYYPKFEWPRINNPKLRFPITPQVLEEVEKEEKIAIEQIKNAFHKHKNDIAGIIIEPIQGEGGDNHFRNEFLQQLRILCDENEAMLIFDEVQTGVGITGTFWAHEQMDVKPDILVFGKKMQICGILSTDRVDEVTDNVFHKSSRINSTWGGNLADMARATKYLEIIEEENLLENVRKNGDFLLKKLNELRLEFPNLISNVRGRGLFCAFDLPNTEIRNKLKDKCFEKKLLILPSGNLSLRFRPSLNITQENLEEGLDLLKEALREI